MPLKINQKMLEALRKTKPEEIANEIISVQPMPNVDWELLAKSPLWDSFVERHLKK